MANISLIVTQLLIVKDFLKMRFITLVVFVYLLFASCTDGEQILEKVNLDFGYDYFPLEVGDYLIYEVDSVIYDPQGNFVAVDTNTIQVREEIVAALESENGQTFYRIERSERDSVAMNWELTNVFSAYQTEQEAVRQEENLRFIKLVFPLETDKLWNANANFDENTNVSIAGETLKMFQNWQTTVEDISPSVTIEGTEFEDVVTISLVNNENLIEYRFGKEQYAKNIGLIYRELWVLDTQNIADTLSWTEKAEKGFILKQRLIEHH